MERAGERGQETGSQRESLTHKTTVRRRGEKTLIAHHTSFKEQFVVESTYPARI